MERPFFFSIVVPAHNEEKYIEETLRHLDALDYPKDSYEAIVIENGSTDLTHEKAKPFACENIQIYSIKKRGVSSARNHGLNSLSSKTDWILFLDADTHLAASFLRELNVFLQHKRSRSAVVGTTAMLPTPSTKKARAWFVFYDISHQLTKSSCSLFIVRRDTLGEKRFDEGQALLEDLTFIRMMLQDGTFFFMRTKSVATSTRRFEADGWVRLFLLYMFVGILPHSWQRHFGYDPVR